MGTLPGHVAVAIVDRLFASGWWDDLGVLFWRESEWLAESRLGSRLSGWGGYRLV